MSRDESRRVRRPRVVEPPRPLPGPLGDLKRWVYTLYIEAGPPTLDEIVDAIQSHEDLPGAPSRDTVARCLGGPQLPANQADVVTIAAVLAYMAAMDVTAAATRARNLWVACRTYEPIGQKVNSITDPYALEVHRSIPIDQEAQATTQLPLYVARQHDRALLKRAEDALNDRSHIVTLVGTSSSGKTRACWELMQDSRFREWRLWHPIDPSRPESLLDGINKVDPHTVIWLNDAHDYLLPSAGERVAAGLRSLLRDECRNPVFILATVWPEEWSILTAPRNPNVTDMHPQGRALLLGSDIPVPPSFQADDLRGLNELSQRDARLAEARQKAKGSRITQYLAGVPVLRERFRNSPPMARAVIEVAMDARRLGHSPEITQSFLREAAPGYINEYDWNLLPDDWFEQAIRYSCTPCLGVPGPLTKVRVYPDTDQSAEPRYRLADTLEEEARFERRYLCPASSFWRSAERNSRTPHDTTSLADSARERALYLASEALYEAAASHNDTRAIRRLANLVTDPDTHEQLLRRAARLGDSFAKYDLASFLRETGGSETEITELLIESADKGNAPATHLLQRSLEDEELPGNGGTQLNNISAWEKAISLQDSGNNIAAFEIFKQEAGRGDPYAKIEVAVYLAREGKQAEAEDLADQAASAGLIYAWDELLFLKITEEDYPEAERLAFRMLGAYDYERFAESIERIKDKIPREEIERILRKAIDGGHASAVLHSFSSPYPGITDWGIVREMGLMPDGSIATRKGYGVGGSW
ncbi:hypothetical protein ACFWCA_41450 [Streptomyces phaeochromogenes]|uniref:hypothetical protein n=1 Tax=Streptomyces phaeochromogenes TaxID=1923 RepID=UPI0036B8CF3C